jgi:hypothetical protein
MGAVGAQTVDTSKRLASLRELMNQNEYSVQVFVVPSEDQRRLFSVHLPAYLFSFYIYRR